MKSMEPFPPEGRSAMPSQPGTHHTSGQPGRRPMTDGLNFHQAPFLVIWEVTRACELKCLHCRAEAQPLSHPDELDTEEGLALLDEIRRFGQPLFIFTGGDPLKRPDIFDLIAHAKTIGLTPGMSPSGTPLLNRTNLARAAAAGISTVSISLDAPTAENHDAFRGVPGSFALSTDAARIVSELGMRLQINTAISAYNLDQLDQMADLVVSLGATRWEVFFLVPTGRGLQLDEVSAADFETVCHWLYGQTYRLEAHITAVEAGFYRRVVLQRLAGEQQIDPLSVWQNSRSGHGRFLPGMNSGSGFIFISHIGEIYPSGFLPLMTGNVRQDSLVETYRNHPVFRQLRDPDLLKGRCGRCEYRALCGGSRARAYAMTGDYLEADPACAYQPEMATAATT